MKPSFQPLRNLFGIILPFSVVSAAPSEESSSFLGIWTEEATVPPSGRLSWAIEVRLRPRDGGRA